MTDAQQHESEQPEAAAEADLEPETDHDTQVASPAPTAEGADEANGVEAGQPEEASPGTSQEMTAEGAEGNTGEAEADQSATETTDGAAGQWDEDDWDPYGEYDYGEDHDGYDYPADDDEGGLEAALPPDTGTEINVPPQPGEPAATLESTDDGQPPTGEADGPATEAEEPLEAAEPPRPPSKLAWFRAVQRVLARRREEEPPGGREQDFLEHLAELRDRLIKIIMLVMVGACLCWGFYDKQTAVTVRPHSPSLFRRVSIHLVHEDQVTKPAGLFDKPALDRVQQLEDKTEKLESRIAALEAELGLAPETPPDTGEGKESIRGDASPPLEPPSGEWTITLPSLWGILTGPVREPLEKKGIRTVFQSPIEPLLVRCQVVAVAGIVVLSPFIFYQVWAFIFPALYVHERRAVRPLIPASFLLFWCGVTLAYKVIPIFFLFLLSFATGEAEVLNFVKWYIPFMAKVCLSMGVVFQMPIAFWLLGQIGVVSASGLLAVWRHAVVVIFIVAAIITPTWDPFNLCLMALPICALYFISVALVWFTQRNRDAENETETTEED